MTQNEINEMWEKSMLKSADKIGRKYQAWMMERQGLDSDYSPFDVEQPELKDN